MALRLGEKVRDRRVNRDAWAVGRRLRNCTEALIILQPMVYRFAAIPGTEIITAAYIPDAVAAVATLGPHTDAEPLIEAFKDNGKHLDRPWMLAIGSRRSIALGIRARVAMSALLSPAPWRVAGLRRFVLNRRAAQMGIGVGRLPRLCLCDRGNVLGERLLPRPHDHDVKLPQPAVRQDGVLGTPDLAHHRRGRGLVHRDHRERGFFMEVGASVLRGVHIVTTLKWARMRLW
jgi:hypothetical protein